MSSFSNSIPLRDSQAIDLLRVVAMLSVMAAHVNKIIEDNTIDLCITRFWNAFGTVGVVIFFILGGLFYHRMPGDGLTFWCKKLHRLVIPWLICATLTYLLSVLLSQQISCLAFIRWVLGMGTWYYYIIVFLICLFIFKWIKKSTVALWGCIVLTILSLLFEYFHCIPHNSFFTKYTNVCNWIGYFAIGCFSRKIGWRNVRDWLMQKWVIGGGITLFVVLLFIILQLKEFTYFNPVAFLWGLVAFGILFQLCWFTVQGKSGEILATFGRETYCIYLIHMQFVQALCARMPRTTLFEILNPVIALIMITFLVFLIGTICSHFTAGKQFQRLIGLPVE